METYYKDTCPKCGSKNFYCNGDENDMTRPDVDAVKCWNCETIWSLEDKIKRVIKEDDAQWLEDGVKELKQKG